MGKKLTQEEWQEIKPPFVWLKLKVQIDPIQFDFIEKWLNDRTSGWWYERNGSSGEYTYVFELEVDRVMFKLWAANNPFEEDHGEL